MPNYLDKKYDGGYASDVPTYSDTEILDWLDKNTKDELNNECWLQECYCGYEDCKTLRDWIIKQMQDQRRVGFSNDQDRRQAVTL